MSSEVRQYTVGADDDGVRLDRWFKRHLPQVGFATVSRWARTGQIRVDGKRADPADRLRIALIQESIDTIFEYHPERNVEAFRRYLDRTAAACAEHGPLDVVVWPESMFTENTPEFLADPGVTSDELLARQDPRGTRECSP